jgi:benzodiazapine receptor
MSFPNPINQWYLQLIKPSWAPPSYIFRPIWGILYTIIVITFGAVFYQVYMNMIPTSILLPFILNLIFNLSFTYIQFDLKNNIFASIDILLILCTLIWALIVIFPYMKWITIMNLPYLTWVVFATILQLTITWMNDQTPISSSKI